ncbi:hypothetical protein SDC9_199957 [bioreactor metagenome]|uniref:Uncharacterized protein n=1 Tax=bioreactor metagenome TaxID=1076179 RepID=A0A645ILX6_9ZZZZ|nr:hypothetical protein [Christensenella sp.]MEA5003832.1 hypothetical protein [Christensenella sp.]
MNDIEKAIKSLKNIIEYWTYKPTEVEAATLAITALLEKQEREQGCETCENYFALQYAKYSYNECESNSECLYCPNCGRKLRED